jgi:hypothetical protein
MITSVVLKTEAGGHAGPGWLKDAAGAAQRARGRFCLAEMEISALSAPVFGRQNWGHPASLNRSGPA